MNISTWYEVHFEKYLSGRYITLKDLLPLLQKMPKTFKVSTAGTSENGLDIPLIKFGQGKKKVLAWSQMHGNESTTTKGLFDFFKLIGSENTFETSVKQFLEEYTFFVIPMLNPDGALLYTRHNANDIDLNRDAQALSQKESIVLRILFEEVKPDICLNMHDQRSIFGTLSGFPATISFLTPSADQKRTVTAARKEAMRYILKAERYLQTHIPNQVARFDDAFNANCVGDTFSQLGVPTILFEAGHYNLDYNREKTRGFIFYSLVAMFTKIASENTTAIDHERYFDIPENQKNCADVLLKNVFLPDSKNTQDITLQYDENLMDGTIFFQLRISDIGGKNIKYGHKIFNLNGNEVLINSQKKFHIGQDVESIFDNKRNLMLI